MHEEDARLLVEHVAVQRGDLDAVGLQGLITGLISVASSTKSPVMAAVSKPVGWKLMAIAAPMAPGRAMPWSVTGWARGMPNW